MDMIEDDNVDAGRQEIVEYGAPAPVRSIPPQWRGAALAVAAVALAGGAWIALRPAEAASRVALAIPAGSIESVRANLARAGIACEVRGGALWVQASDAPRAADAAMPRSSANAVAAALEDESVFASGESSRARRLGATIKTLEQSIAMQPGVERATVVVSDAPRSFAPGASGGAGASVTVAMRSGTMPQDLVDAVAVMVAGACGGMRPESVAIIDAGSGRVRSVRDADARVRADVSRAREERASELVTALLSDIPGVSVRVHEGEGGAMVAAIELPHSVAITRAEYEAGGDLARYLDIERTRVAERLDLFLSAPGAQVCAVSVALAPQAESEHVVSARPVDAYSASNPARIETDEAAARERGMPLGGSGAAQGFPIGWAFAALAGVAALAWWAWRRPAPAGSAALAAEVAMPAFDEEPIPGSEASDAVRAAPEEAATVVRAWIDGGGVERAARLVVALDASAAASILQALPVTHVQQVTAALSTLDAPEHAELQEAVQSFLEELELGDVGDYRAAHEAA